jgi:hypothetical protein
MKGDPAGVPAAPDQRNSILTDQKKLRARNIRLALVLALIVLLSYVGMAFRWAKGF